MFRELRCAALRAAVGGALVLAWWGEALSQRTAEVDGEIIMAATGLTGQYEPWTVTAECQSGVRWKWQGGLCPLTTDYGRAEVDGYGNGESCGGFRSSVVEHGEQTLAFGEYEFTFHLPSGYPEISFSLDLRDADWTAGYTWPYDISIRWDVQAERLEKTVRGSGQGWSERTESAIWEILDEGDPNQEAFQPTPPRNLSCTNAGQTWQHPHFTWCAPEAPEGVNFTYKIYRKAETPSWDEVASDLTVTEWTDREVVINPSGRRYWYRATANSGQSPDSEPSNEVSVNGYLGKPVAEGTGNSELEGGHVRLGVYPNPFNTSATISYSVPAPGEVSLILCDVEGRQLRRLVEAHQSAGSYHLAMDGGALPSGVYLLRLLWGGQSLSYKVLLVR
ncbi:MAG: T9SS type A sorting domain-containing protein [Calditrichaeota bacterium]|nr:T9SS type A sorting domain-containing protein [Calditrichota bacterium]